MNVDSPSSREFSQPAQENLTEAQKAIIDRVLAILDNNPQLKEEINKRFEKNLQDIVSDAEKFNLLLEKIGATEMQKLGEIEQRYQKKGITGEQAIEESKRIIEHYTQMKLTALKGNIPFA